MISFITGVPGGGKTYKAMYDLFTFFAKDNKEIKVKKSNAKGLKRALTNINEIKLDRFNNVSPMDWDDFYDSLSTLHKMYLNKSTDTELKTLAEELEILDALIILDECHNYLNSQNKVIVWWLTYHRHLHQEIYLITQNLSLVNSIYKGTTEKFFKALPPSLKLFNNNMVYFEFMNPRMSKNASVGTVKIPIIQGVFNSYGSGKNQKSKSIVLKFLLMSLSFLVLVIAILSLVKFIYVDTPKVKDEVAPIGNNKSSKVVNNEDSNIENNDNDSLDIDLENSNFMSLKCHLKYKYCLYNKKKIQLSTYYKLKKIFDIEELSISQINNDFVQLDILADKQFYNIFNGGLQNENNLKNNTMSSNIFSNN